VSSFLDTILELSIITYKPIYKDRRDVGLVNQEVDFVATAASTDISSLDSVVRSVARMRFPTDSARSLSPSCRSSLDDISGRLRGRTKTLQHVLNIIEGREDWSILAPPRTPPQRRKSSLRVDSKNVSFASSTNSLEGSSGSRSSPPSPYRVTMEEVPDEGEDEQRHNVHMYHAEPVDYDSRPNSQETDMSKSISSLELPKVVLRAPTDPSGLHEAVKELRMGLENENPEYQPPNSPRTPTIDTASKDIQHFNRPRTTSAAAAESESLGIEIRRLEAELARLKAGSPSPSSGYASSKFSTESQRESDRSKAPYSGLGLNSSDERLHPLGPRAGNTRPRASTTESYGRSPMSERYRHYHTDSYERGRDNVGYVSATSPREPMPPTFVSPRHSPRSATVSVHNSPRYPAERDFHGSSVRGRSGSGSAGSRSGSGSRWRKDREDRVQAMFGPDPHSSLPVVLEQRGASKWSEREREQQREDERRRERERERLHREKERERLLMRRESLSRRNSTTDRGYDRQKRSSWAPPPEPSQFASSPNLNVASPSTKRRSWAPSTDEGDWPKGDFQLFSDMSDKEGPPAPMFAAKDASPKTDPVAPVRVDRAKEKARETERPRSPSPTPPNVAIKDLPVTLEDIFHGSTIRVRFKRRLLQGTNTNTNDLPDTIGIVDTRGRTRSRSRSEQEPPPKPVEPQTEDVILPITLPRGLKPGSKLKYVNQGDYLDEATARQTGKKRGDIWFRLVEREHVTFERRGLHLHAEVEISLQEALCGGWSRDMKSICGKQVNFGPGEPVTVEADKGKGKDKAVEAMIPVTADGSIVTYRGLGMPKYQREAPKTGEGNGKDAEFERGDMIVETRVIWPEMLADWQRELIVRALGPKP
jgi:hypothetical protein